MNVESGESENVLMDTIINIWCDLELMILRIILQVLTKIGPNIPLNQDFYRLSSNSILIKTAECIMLWVIWEMKRLRIALTKSAYRRKI